MGGPGQGCHRLLGDQKRNGFRRRSVNFFTTRVARGGKGVLRKKGGIKRQASSKRQTKKNRRQEFLSIMALCPGKEGGFGTKKRGTCEGHLGLIDPETTPPGFPI